MLTNTSLDTNGFPSLTGKTTCNENFPVGSFLLSETVRPIVGAFYRFARSADDIADDPELGTSRKLALLHAMDRALHGMPSTVPQCKAAQQLHNILMENKITTSQPHALLIAFQHDAINEDCQSLNDLLDYCYMSANPVGRFLLEIHKENTDSAIIASDALCTSLQILNHLQDCRKDFLALSRVYIPIDMLRLEGLARSTIGSCTASHKLLRIFASILEQVESLLTIAQFLPRNITDRGFRIETAIIVELAIRLMERLRNKDLLARFHGLQKSDWLFAAFSSFIRFR